MESPNIGDLDHISPSSMSTERPSRYVARQACDVCRIRKSKCNNNLDEPNSPPSSSGPFGLSRDGIRRCQRCTKLDLSCTYLLPTGTRGPRRKNKSATQAAPLHDRSSKLNLPTFREDALQSSHQPLQYSTESICSRAVFHQIMADYLELLYPLIPIVHRPSFRSDLARNRDLYENDFLSVVIALCAVTVGTMPTKFREYRAAEPPIPFQSRTEMINRCYEIIMGLRRASYFDEVNYSKWAVSYLMQISFFQIGQHNRARMVEVEGMQLARLLDFHQISMYDGLNCIETQLRKKGFWLMFYGYVHGQLQNLRKERLCYLDEVLLGGINLEELIPLEVDDEMILQDIVLQQPVGLVSITTGFNVHSRVFWAALKSRQPLTHNSSSNDCNCARSLDPTLQLLHLQERFGDLKYMLDNIPTPLRQWTTHLSFPDPDILDPENQRILNGQFASMRANLHVTHLWLQSIILDQIDALRAHEDGHATIPSSTSSSLHSPRASWAEREDICRQLLHILHGVSETYLEPNGHHLTFKVRDVAVTLLACPFEVHEEVSHRAQQYLGEFTNKLSRLDGSETMNTLSLQSWVDTDRRVGAQSCNPLS